MKELLQQFSAYTIWANSLLLDTIVELPEEKQIATLASSFTSMYKTALHMWDAESGWWQRMKLQERLILPSENFSGSMKEVVAGLQQQNGQWNAWLQAAHEHHLQHEFIYYNSKKEKCKQSVFQVLVHLFNHGTYHRGQLVTMLRQSGIEKIPPTDFIVWSRRK